MITIEIVSKEQNHEILSFLNHSEETLINQDHYLIMAAKDKDMILGVAIAEIMDSYAVLIDIVIGNREDLHLEYGMGKAILNAIERRGIMKVYCCNNRLEGLLMRMGFTENTGTVDVPYSLKSCINLYYLNLNHYFTSHSCEK